MGLRYLLAEKIHLVAVDRFKCEVLRVYDVLEIRLSGRYGGGTREYLAGQGKGKYSIADINSWAWIRNIRRIGFSEDELAQLPHLQELLRRDRLWSEVWGSGTTRLCIQNCCLRLRNYRVWIDCPWRAAISLANSFCETGLSRLWAHRPRSPLTALGPSGFPAGLSSSFLLYVASLDRFHPIQIFAFRLLTMTLNHPTT